MGAWIETIRIFVNPEYGPVAPYVGAWIETILFADFLLIFKSHPTWVRGLKQFV